ncbi:hypothetical protein LEMLEM_LOCUS23549 [Lemmus lemmus]
MCPWWSHLQSGFTESGRPDMRTEPCVCVFTAAILPRRQTCTLLYQSGRELYDLVVKTAFVL